MLLMWDRGLHSYGMVNATLARECHYLGRVPANVKFEVEHVLDDGSYLSWISDFSCYFLIRRMTLKSLLAN